MSSKEVPEIFLSDVPESIISQSVGKLNITEAESWRVIRERAAVDALALEEAINQRFDALLAEINAVRLQLASSSEDNPPLN